MDLMTTSPVFPELAAQLEARLTVDPSGCWLWDDKLNSNGYARLMFQGEDWLGHRLMYVATFGTIPDGLDLDHLCHNRDKSCPGGPTCRHRRCVNPEHLDPATRAENHRRSPLVNRPTCKHGHPFNEANTYRDNRGRRFCRHCNRDAQRRYKARQVAA